MAPPAASPESFVPLTETALEILLALAPGELHGYAIMQAVTTRTRGRLQLHPGTLYRALSRMLDRGLICEIAGPPEDDERRRYYRMTELGRRVAIAETERLVDQVAAAQALRLVPEGEGDR